MQRIEGDQPDDQESYLVVAGFLFMFGRQQ